MTTFFYSSLFIFGLLFGSFASVVIWRIRRKESGILTGRSHCPHCKHTLGALDLFPVLSYLFLRGKCRFCGAKIGVVYPLLELSMGILFVLSGWFVVGSPVIIPFPDHQIIWRLAFFLVTAFVTVVFVFYDFLFMEIPDEVMIPLDIILFLLLFTTSVGVPLPFFGHFMLFDTKALNIPIVNAMIGSAGIFLFFYLQIVASKGKWMGGGDLRIAIFMGLVAGAKIAFLGLMLAYFSGSIIVLLVIAKTRSRNTELPFGPYLALGLYLSLFFHTEILDAYIKYLTIQ